MERGDPTRVYECTIHEWLVSLAECDTGRQGAAETGEERPSVTELGDPRPRDSH